MAGKEYKIRQVEDVTHTLDEGLLFQPSIIIFFCENIKTKEDIQKFIDKTTSSRNIYAGILDNIDKKTIFYKLLHPYIQIMGGQEDKKEYGIVSKLYKQYYMSRNKKIGDVIVSILTGRLNQKDAEKFLLTF